MKRKLQFEAGEVIIQEGDVGETAYVIQTGSVMVTKQIDDRAVTLAQLGEGDTFGEMGMIDDQPRSATVSAAVDTIVVELHRDAFFENLRSDPDLALEFLRAIFERLREANIRILQLQTAGPGEAGASPAAPSDAPTAIALEPLTDDARAALPESPFVITKFPFLIGRESSDPLAKNDLEIADQRPWQISRHHLKLSIEGDRIAATDRGSTLGSLIDGEPIGGRIINPGPILIEREAELVLGLSHSPYRFKVMRHAG